MPHSVRETWKILHDLLGPYGAREQMGRNLVRNRLHRRGKARRAVK